LFVCIYDVMLCGTSLLIVMNGLVCLWLGEGRSGRIHFPSYMLCHFWIQWKDKGNCSLDDKEIYSEHFLNRMNRFKKVSQQFQKYRTEVNRSLVDVWEQYLGTQRAIVKDKYHSLHVKLQQIGWAIFLGILLFSYYVLLVLNQTSENTHTWVNSCRC